MEVEAALELPVGSVQELHGQGRSAEPERCRQQCQPGNFNENSHGSEIQIMNAISPSSNHILLLSKWGLQDKFSA